MPDALSFAELEGQHVELLPARTVLSLFNTSSSAGPCNTWFNCNYGGTQTNTTGAGGFNWGNVTYGGTQINSAGGSFPGAGG
jgi:hypothetical protein